MGARNIVRLINDGLTQGLSSLRLYTTGSQDHGTEAVTATADGLTTGLISQGSKTVTVTSGNADHIVNLPAATVGDIINILVTGAACELRSAVTAHKANNLPIGATNELALVQDSLYRCHYVSANNWIVTGVSKVGADEAALQPNAV